MAEDELVYLEGETYYFHPDGRMQADGWVSFSEDSDVVYDYGLDVEEYKDDVVNNVTSNPYSKVWMYFNADGTAYDDEWAEIVDEKTGGALHYYFDDIIMVAGDYDHDVNGTVYGFGTDGHMFVGWEQNYEDLMKTAPNRDDECWYYYEKNGKKFTADKGDGYGWKQIEGEWYCFEEEGASCGTLIVNAYFINSKAGTGNADYYYVDKNGVMATGVVTVDKDALYVTEDYDWADNKKVKNVTDSKSVTAWFGSDGKAKTGWNGDSYYAGMNPENIWEFDTNKTPDMDVVTGSAVADGNNFKAIKGALVKSAFVDKDGYFYVDKYGDKVVNSAIEVGKFAIDTTTKLSKITDDMVVAGNFTASVEATSSNENEAKAYVLCNSKGEIYEAGDVDATRTVKIGAKKYVATDAEFCGMQVFIYVNNN